jgi:2C-methyl-D-erythritol 2,4-cyclodiphosphate synthase
MGVAAAYHVAMGYAVHRMCRPRPLFMGSIYLAAERAKARLSDGLLTL